MNFLYRTEILIGKEALDKLKNATVAIFGIGGVGSYAVEALGRCGIGNIVLIDYDKIDKTNINRQIHAMCKTIGDYKTLAMEKRLIEINPNINIKTYTKMYSADTSKELINKNYDYVIDAIDIIPQKIDLIINCQKSKIPIISSMGAGNKLDPTKFKVSDIYSTSICPLAKVVRQELRKLGVKSLKVVYSTEKPYQIKKKPIGSVSFVPSVAGLILASVVIRELIAIPIDR